MTPKELETEALQLNPAARARLAKKLLNSLDVLSEAEVERLWVEEAERRNEQIERGVVEARRAEDVIRDARSLRGIRNDRSEKVGTNQMLRGQIFSIWRCIVILFAEEISGKSMDRFYLRKVESRPCRPPDDGGRSRSISAAQTLPGRGWGDTAEVYFFQRFRPGAEAEEPRTRRCIRGGRCHKLPLSSAETPISAIPALPARGRTTTDTGIALRISQGRALAWCEPPNTRILGRND